MKVLKLYLIQVCAKVAIPSGSIHTLITLSQCPAAVYFVFVFIPPGLCQSLIVLVISLIGWGITMVIVILGQVIIIHSFLVMADLRKRVSQREYICEDFVKKREAFAQNNKSNKKNYDLKVIFDQKPKIQALFCQKRHSIGFFAPLKNAYIRYI